MRRRIYRLLPDLGSARAAMQALLQARVAWRDMHFVGRDDVEAAGLHAANVLQTSDLVRSARMGLIVGSAMGALIGAFVAVDYPIVGDEPEWGLALALAIAGALFGPWTSSMIGVSIPSEPLKHFAPQIRQGQILLMVDVPAQRVDQIEAQLRAFHPQAHLEDAAAAP